MSDQKKRKYQALVSKPQGQRKAERVVFVGGKIVEVIREPPAGYSTLGSRHPAKLKVELNLSTYVREKVHLQLHYSLGLVTVASTYLGNPHDNPFVFTENQARCAVGVVVSHNPGLRLALECIDHKAEDRGACQKGKHRIAEPPTCTYGNSVYEYLIKEIVKIEHKQREAARGRRLAKALTTAQVKERKEEKSVDLNAAVAQAQRLADKLNAEIAPKEEKVKPEEPTDGVAKARMVAEKIKEGLANRNGGGHAKRNQGLPAPN